jgi:soluble cytochrome b562
MTIKLFDIQNGVVIPTEHCYTLETLKNLMDTYPDSYLKVYQYLFYMTCPNPDLNPFFYMMEEDKEEIILAEIQADFSPEDSGIPAALHFCKKLYETPTSRAYNGIKKMLDKLADYMDKTPITHGRDGNITALVSAASKFQQIRESYKGAYKDLQDEQTSHVRGGQGLAYDQM